MTDTAGGARQIAAAMDGFLTTQLLYVAARLGIAEALADGPRAGAEIAGSIGAEPVALARVLRGLAAEAIVDELDDGRFALAPLGETLRRAQGAVVVRGGLYYRAAAGLLDAVREGGTAFERVYGRRFFDHLGDHPADDAAFHASMAARSEREAGDVVAAYDFGGLRRLADVGGGSGGSTGSPTGISVIEAIPAKEPT